MDKPELSATRTRELLDQITQVNDGAYVPQLIELVHGIHDPNKIAAKEAEKYLYCLTPDFQEHLEEYFKKRGAA